MMQRDRPTKTGTYKTKTLGRPLWLTVLGLKWFWEPGGNHWLFMALSLPFVGWLSLSQRMWLAEWSPPTAQRHKYMFGSKFPYLVDILPLREGHLCPSSISRHSESQSADSFLEEEGGTEEYTCPDYCQGTKGQATAAARTETETTGIYPQIKWYLCHKRWRI